MSSAAYRSDLSHCTSLSHFSVKGLLLNPLRPQAGGPSAPKVSVTLPPAESCLSNSSLQGLACEPVNSFPTTEQLSSVVCA